MPTVVVVISLCLSFGVYSFAQTSVTAGEVYVSVTRSPRTIFQGQDSVEPGSPSLAELWSSHFSGSTDILPDPYRNLLSLLRLDEACKGSAEKLSKQLDLYNLLAFRSQERGARKLYLEIQESLMKGLPLL